MARSPSPDIVASRVPARSQSYVAGATDTRSLVPAPLDRWCWILGSALRQYFRERVPEPPQGLLPRPDQTTNLAQPEGS